MSDDNFRALMRFMSVGFIGIVLIFCTNKIAKTWLAVEAIKAGAISIQAAKPK